MKNAKIYLDTSVISHLDAQDTPEKMADTKLLWEQIRKGKYDVVLSEVVFAELYDCHEPKRSFLTASVQQIQYERIDSNNSDVVALANKFVDMGILGATSFDDCRHISTAILAGCDMIVSWNFKHIVNPKTIKGTKVITIMEGYKDILICSPAMLIGDVNDE
ncbi:MAG: PIN domain nuclease [Chitinispirillia bacterium]|nr:PIN domain nuclease [Chitinispirillia bacterium]MCL2269016.1 PIN domain nuclease [Chitinispirillia bacterium]